MITSRLSVIALTLLHGLVIYAHDPCVNEFSGLEDSCVCHDSMEGDDAWCPNSENPKIRLHLQPQALWVNCYEAQEDDMKEVLKNVTLGHTLTTVEFKHCPIPNSSYADIILGMNKTNLFEFRASYCFGDELMAGQFEGLGATLKKMRLNNNFLGKIHPEAFRGLPNLEELHLGENKIASLPSIFKGLTNLVSLELIESKVDAVPDGLFQSLTLLSKLELQLGVIPKANWFEGSTALTSIMLHQIDGSQVLDENNMSLFHHMTGLMNVSISGTNFSELPEGLFSSNQQLELFRWAFDRCPQCYTQPKSFLKNHTSLKKFEIVQSQSKGIVFNEDFFWGCTNLDYVKINRGRITEIPELFFRDSPKLRAVDMSWNRITALPSKLFHFTNELSFVVMHRNLIGTIDDQHFEKANMLRLLDMSMNNISSLSSKALANLNSIQELNLSENNIFFDDVSQPVWRAMTGIKVLNLGGNKIQISRIPERLRTSKAIPFVGRYSL